MKKLADHKQRVVVRFPFDGKTRSVPVMVSPPLNVTQALTAAAAIAAAKQQLPVDYALLADMLTRQTLQVVWGEILPTKKYLRELSRPPRRKTRKEQELEVRRELADLQAQAQTEMPFFCPLCDFPNKVTATECWDCGYLLQPELAEESKNPPVSSGGFSFLDDIILVMLFSDCHNIVAQRPVLPVRHRLRSEEGILFK